MRGYGGADSPGETPVVMDPAKSLFEGAPPLNWIPEPTQPAAVHYRSSAEWPEFHLCVVRVPVAGLDLLGPATSRRSDPHPPTLGMGAVA